MKCRWEAVRKAAGKPIDKPDMISGPLQICWHELTRYWDIEHREIPMENNRLLMTPKEVLKWPKTSLSGVPRWRS